MKAAACAAAVLALAAVGCGGSSSGSDSGKATAAGDAPTASTGTTAPAKGEPVTVATAFEPLTLDPQNGDDNGIRTTMKNVYESLYGFGPDGKVVPQLADGMPKLVNDTTWRIKLLQGVKFSTGAPFDADAAVFSINRELVPKRKKAWSSSISTLVSAKKVDASTIEVKTDGYDALTPSRLNWIAMIDPAAVKSKVFPAKSTGTGPYMMQSYSRSQQMVIVRNPDYRGDPAPVPQVTFKFITDPSTRLQAFSAGEVDVVPNISPDDATSVKKSVDTPEPVTVGIIRLNTYKKPFNDPNVRLALSLAVDRQRLATALLGGKAVAAPCQAGTAQVGGFNKSVTARPYDLDKAKQLVKAAGAVGQTITLVFPSGLYVQDRATGEAVADAWKQLGLNVKLRLLSYDAWVKAVYVPGDAGVSAVFMESTNPTNHLDQATNNWYIKDGPVSAFNDPTGSFGQALKDARAEKDDAAREAKYEEIGKKACDDSVLVYLLARRDTFALSNKVDYKPYPEASSTFRPALLTPTGSS